MKDYLIMKDYFYAAVEKFRDFAFLSAENINYKLHSH